MKLTNIHNLPETIVNVIKRPTYSKGKANLSVTEMMSSPRIVQLKRKHWDELTEDAAEMVWSIFGTAIHNLLEHGKDDHHIIEERVFAKVGGYIISGAIDLQEVYDDGIVLSDYKTTSVYAVMNQKMDWTLQLNCYAYLLVATKQAIVKKLQIVAIIRDWSARDARTRVGYPAAPIIVIDIPMWTHEEREQYILGRITKHDVAMFEAETGSEVAECTPEEMWESTPLFAVKKEGNVRAKSVHARQSEADAALADAELNAKKGEKFFIELRPGERKRCANFCQVSDHCSQYQTYLTAQETP